MGACLPSSARPAGRLRAERMMFVSMSPGQTTDTPMGAPAASNSLYIDSDRATTPCLVTSWTDCRRSGGPASRLSSGTQPTLQRRRGESASSAYTAESLPGRAGACPIGPR